MTIKVGDTIPPVSLKILDENGIKDVDFNAYIAGRKVVVFGVPGAFTPVCTNSHVPGYVDNQDKLREKGIDEVICIAVNDPFVMNHWAHETGVAGAVTMLPDGNATLTKALGFELDASGVGLGVRSQRFSMVVNDGVVEDLQVENDPSLLELSAAEACLARL